MPPPESGRHKDVHVLGPLRPLPGAQRALPPPAPAPGSAQVWRRRRPRAAWGARRRGPGGREEAVDAVLHRDPAATGRGRGAGSKGILVRRGSSKASEAREGCGWKQRGDSCGPVFALTCCAPQPTTWRRRESRGGSCGAGARRSRRPGPSRCRPSARRPAPCRPGASKRELTPASGATAQSCCHEGGCQIRPVHRKLPVHGRNAQQGPMLGHLNGQGRPPIQNNPTCSEGAELLWPEGMHGAEQGNAGATPYR